VGAGDWILAAGEARAAHVRNGLPCLIVDRMGRPQWNEVFDGNPYILRRKPADGRVNLIKSASGQRPYILHKTMARWLWAPYKPRPAELFFTAEEKAFAEPYRGKVMIEPNVKANRHTNKEWLWPRWQEVAATVPNAVQCGPSGTRWLAGVTQVGTATFRQACAVLSVCKAFVGTEGGLMHAAAATGTPSVILWSEFISPSVTGYTTMANLRHAGKPCGMRVNCRGCRKSMEAISVTEVVAALKGVLR
jgi:ADP-heptose:LPS heptosyltransferase